MKWGDTALVHVHPDQVWLAPLPCWWRKQVELREMDREEALETALLLGTAFIPAAEVMPGLAVAVDAN